MGIKELKFTLDVIVFISIAECKLYCKWGYGNILGKWLYIYCLAVVETLTEHCPQQTGITNSPW